MEIATRNISLIPSIGRLGSMIPSYNEDGNELNSGNTENYSDWGHYPMDIRLNGSLLTTLAHIEDGIPLNGNILRYKNMSDAFGFLKNFSHGCKYYRMIKRNGEDVWSEVSDTMWDECYYLIREYGGNAEKELADPYLFMTKFFVYEWKFKDRLPEISSATTTEKRGIAVNPDTDTFLERFRDNSDTRYEKTFYNLVRWLIDNKHEPKYTNQVSYEIPFNKISFLVDSDISVTGVLRPYIEDWIPNKRYYKNDCVWWTDDEGDTKAYKLTNFKSNDPSDSNGKYWKGYWDNGVVYFDTHNASGITFDHWEECPTSGTTATQNTESTIDDSYLKFMQRLRKSYDDEGNELPFNISGNTTNTELRYRLGNMNTSYKDGKITFDRLKKVTIYGSSGRVLNIFNYNYNTDGIIPTSGISDSGVYIEFVYYDNMSNENSGVKHTEIYSFEKKTKNGVKVDGSTKNYKYIDIDYSKTYVKEGNKFTTDYEVKSQISYSIGSGGNDPSQDIPVFSDEALLGVSSFRVDADVNIERGGASAFERHHILSEVNTFEDLLNYKNNMFNL